MSVCDDAKLTPDASLTLERLGPGHVDRLTEFFMELSADRETCRFFHPHPFTDEQAMMIAGCPGRDYYAGLFQGRSVVGYGMLRGWDEGYEIPSLGIVIASPMRGAGLSRLLVEYLHAVARLRGVPRIILKVYKNNAAAVALYRRMGYRLVELNEQEWKGQIDLRLGDVAARQDESEMTGS